MRADVRSTTADGALLIHGASRRLRTLFMVILAVVSLTVLSGEASADWGDCEDELDRLRRLARDASDAAQEAKAAADEVESKADEVRSAASSLRLCSGDCWYERSQYQSARDDFESAKDDYESAVARVDSEVADVLSGARRVEAACQVSSGRRGADPAVRFCGLLRRYKGKLSDQALMTACRRSLTEEDCRRCLE